MRRLLLKSGDEATSDGVAYCETITFDERPTAASITFECPGCTHFAIRIVGEANYDTGSAFFASVVADKDYTVMAGTGNSGTAMTSGGRYQTGTAGTAHTPIIKFTNSGVEMSLATDSVVAYTKWFQAGTYEWIAW